MKSLKKIGFILCDFKVKKYVSGDTLCRVIARLEHQNKNDKTHVKYKITIIGRVCNIFFNQDFHVCGSASKNIFSFDDLTI